jgi:hypothetical protein
VFHLRSKGGLKKKSGFQLPVEVVGTPTPIQTVWSAPSAAPPAASTPEREKRLWTFCGPTMFSKNHHELSQFMFPMLPLIEVPLKLSSWEAWN